LDEAVAVAVSSSDDFLLRCPYWSVLIGLRIFSKNCIIHKDNFWTIPPTDTVSGPSHRCHQKLFNLLVTSW